MSAPPVPSRQLSDDEYRWQWEYEMAKVGSGCRKWNLTWLDTCRHMQRPRKRRF